MPAAPRVGWHTVPPDGGVRQDRPQRHEATLEEDLRDASLGHNEMPKAGQHHTDPDPEGRQGCRQDPLPSPGHDPGCRWPTGQSPGDEPGRASNARDLNRGCNPGTPVPGQRP